MSVRLWSWIGCEQPVSAANSRSQRPKSVPVAVVVSSAVAPDPEPGERFGIGSGCRGGHDAWPQRCWAAWRVMPSREPISAQE